MKSLILYNSSIYVALRRPVLRGVIVNLIPLIKYYYIFHVVNGFVFYVGRGERENGPLNSGLQ